MRENSFPRGDDEKFMKTLVYYDCPRPRDAGKTLERENGKTHTWPASANSRSPVGPLSLSPSAR